jgi:polyphosphate:AMP phosphotransferase
VAPSAAVWQRALEPQVLEGATMFEAAEVGRKVSKQDFKQQEPELHTQLLEVQRALRGSNTPVIVLVSGVEGAGKGAVVNRLHAWLDARGMRTATFWEESDEEQDRPRFWRFWRALPPRGTIGVLFGSWYTRPIIDHVFEHIDEAAFDRELARIATFERMLSDDGALIVKFWFHLSKDVQRKRLKRDLEEGHKSLSTSIVKKFTKHYDTFAAVSERAIRETDTGQCPWHIIESANARYRDLTAGATLLNAIRRRLATQRSDTTSKPPDLELCAPQTPDATITILDHVDLSATLDADEYEHRLEQAQKRLGGLCWSARRKRRNVVAVFEGWDAAGKGGAIRRVTAAMDARLYRVISIAAPTDEEKAQHYLWRFWRQIPRAGYVTIYDRSWYGRVLVERVEGITEARHWMRGYKEINEFEEELTDHGVVLLKFWIHMSRDEQLRRFEERSVTPWKQHKITDEDWRNRERWDDYNQAANDMITRTSTEFAPWTLVAGNDKKSARVQIAETFCERLASALADDG